MSHLSKITFFVILLMFLLACNFVARPIDEAQDAVETLEAIPSALPEIEVPTGVPDISSMEDPKDPPLTEWNGLPIIPSATAGDETTGIYSFKTTAPLMEVFEYYKLEMANLGWNEFFSMPNAESGAILTYEKDDRLVTITITADGEGSLVFLTYQ